MTTYVPEINRAGDLRVHPSMRSIDENRDGEVLRAEPMMRCLRRCRLHRTVTLFTTVGLGSAERVFCDHPVTYRVRDPGRPAGWQVLKNEGVEQATVT